MKKISVFSVLAAMAMAVGLLVYQADDIDASSHREAPLISNDPLADNTDLYAFRSPANPDNVIIIANYIPLELPEGGPNYNTFGEDIRYEIHIKNQPTVGPLGSAHDDITYRFTFQQENEDPTTFFNIRLGQNLKTTYTLEKSVGGSTAFTPILTGGIVPPNNIGPRSTSFAGASSYSELATAAIMTASTGEKVFCGPRDDAFFVDLGGIFDLGQTRSSYGLDPGNPDNARDAVAGFNTHSIALEIPINMLQREGKGPAEASSIIDPDFVIGVWASASRPQIRTLSPVGEKPVHSGEWIQVSRIGMPLTNEAIIPIADKDKWNAVTPYSEAEQSFVKYFANPELALYMDDGGDPGNPAEGLGDLIPALSALRVQSMSYPAIGVIPGYSEPGFDFRTGKDGAFAAAAIDGIDFGGTAIAVPTGPAAPGLPIQTALVAPGEPRRADILPIFYFGVPNVPPYQLATGKTGGPLSPGKPFIHNFLPVTQVDGVLYGGDMLRLNMATPVTPRNSDEFRINGRMGLIRAAAIGLTAAPFNTNTDLEAMPHMDGFPNGRRLEDDVTTIELQAVGGLVLAAVGFGFDDATAGDYSDLASPALVAELTYNAGPTANDLPLLEDFPFQADPHSGYDYVKQLTAQAPLTEPTSVDFDLGLSVPRAFMIEQNYPNPFNPTTAIQYHVNRGDDIRLKIYNAVGQEVATLVEGFKPPGTYTVSWDASGQASGIYYYRLEVGGKALPAKKALLLK